MKYLRFEGMFVEPNCQNALQMQMESIVTEEVSRKVTEALEAERSAILKEFRVVRCFCGDPIRVTEDGRVWTLGEQYHKCPQVKAEGSYR